MRWESWKGVLSCCLCSREMGKAIPSASLGRGPALSTQNFEIRQSSVMSSLWLSCLVPTGVQGHRGPSSGRPYHLRARYTFTHLAPLPFCPGPPTQPREMLGEKIINLNGGLATFLQMLAFFNHRSLWEEVFLNKETPKGRVSRLR